MESNITKFVQGLKQPQSVYELFEFLNYKVFDPSYIREVYKLVPNKEVAGNINQIYQIAFVEDKIPIFLVDSKIISRSFFRQLTHQFSRHYPLFFFVVTHDWQEYHFILPQKVRKDPGEFQLKITQLIVNRDNPFRTDLEILLDLQRTDDDKTYRDIWHKWEKAFDRDRVTEKFFTDYKNIFFKIRHIVVDQGIAIRQAHEFTQQLLNRLMFNYFIAKKRWLGNNPRFMSWFWEEYKRAKRQGKIKKDTFYVHWLQVLFLEAFNNKFYSRSYFPQEINHILGLAPYLNGGLFKENELDQLLDVHLKDELFEEIFRFLNKYNFTIREDLPLEVEVAVDPEMLGYVYESLANVAEEIYDRQDLGIFYTPRVEVDFMCRRSLVEYFFQNISGVEKDIWYHLLFDEDKTTAEKYLTSKNLWQTLEEKLDQLRVVDPACGSGAFLVGMLLVLTELYRMVYSHLPGREIDDFNLKKRIIQNSLYGVDVMPWAVHSAELRLWLQLVVETEMDLGQLKEHPLLPNFNLKLRVGDSLVQELGGVDLRARGKEIPSAIKKRFDYLAKEKEKFFLNDSTCKFKDPKALQEEEVRIYRDFIRHRIIQLNQVLDLGRQDSLIGKNPDNKPHGQKKLLDKRKEAARKEIEQLQKILKKLSDPANKPFVWNIDFAEIFGEKGGFDIVIGNPPYVRQEKIAPPNRAADETTLDDRRQYKEKLQRSLLTIYPFWRKISGRSDYYVYFYFHGLNLLNSRGTFCFITSNSWLDVDYGKDLQEFLLKYVPMHAIYDNHAKRSFKHADVNTIIALFGAPKIINQGRRWSSLSHTVKFVAFKKPFEEVLNTTNLLAIEKATELVKQEAYRVFPIRQEALLEEGWEYPHKEAEVGLLEGQIKHSPFDEGKYMGNKWGGKYFRAPEIFFTILEKGKGKLVRLGDIAEVRFGIKTGANDFFYVEDVTDKNPDLSRVQNLRGFKSIEEIKQRGLRVIKPSKYKKTDREYKLFLVEEEYLKPVVKSPREIKSIFVNEENLKFKVIMCHESKKELSQKNAFILEYLKWGETKREWKKANGRYNPPNLRPTCRSRKYWWAIKLQLFPDFIWFKAFNDRYLVPFLGRKYFTSDRFYAITVNEEENIYLIMNSINSVIQNLFCEINGRVNLAEGALDNMRFEVNNVLILKISKMKPIFKRKIKSIFEEYGINKYKPVWEQDPSPLSDRKVLDDIVFDELGLTDEERKEVYWAVAELVKNRLEKARSV